MKFKIYLLMFVVIFSINTKAEMFPTAKQKGNILLKKIDYKDQEISYFIYMPDSEYLKKNKKHFKDTTMYFIFHGETSKAEDFLNKTDLHSKIVTDGNSFISFNSSANDWFSHKRKNIKDEDFILKLINKAQKYKSGGIYRYKDFKIIAYSSGASLINRFICNDKLRNINNYLLINGSGKNDWLNNCNSLKNKNINIISSKDDDYYTYDKTQKPNKKYKLPEENFSTIKEYNKNIRIKMGCDAEPVFIEIDNTLEDSSHIDNEIYSCTNSNELKIYLLNNSGHNIPNVKSYSLEDFRGNVNKDIHIYDIINQ